MMHGAASNGLIVLHSRQVVSMDWDTSHRVVHAATLATEWCMLQHCIVGLHATITTF
jgi:hypothetical protein